METQRGILLEQLSVAWAKIREIQPSKRPLPLTPLIENEISKKSLAFPVLKTTWGDSKENRQEKS